MLLGKGIPDIVIYERVLRKVIMNMIQSDSREGKMEYTDFTDDEEKMRDFFALTKEEFLASYSYLTEEEYDLTKEAVDEYRR